MAEKKAYPLRISAEVLDAMQRWSNDELRSLNSQIEYVLRDALRKAGRLPRANEDDNNKEPGK
ncbi:Arc family DNA-binding protein [Pseudoxanthomonas gei]|uniref:Arc family DNA-binding protein n=1 Tax=Pseudoxanthomonas gei TaxID=1383030 RepID=A0ABX0AEH9_9GAMM|nr:Arc family DNA-binding protein [Pseudoxanthomonas gei]